MSPALRPGREPHEGAPLLPPSLAARRPELVEWMDREDCDPVRLRNTFRDFARVNRWVSGWQRLYRERIRPLLHPGRTTRLLDVGCGGGDIPRRLARWARRDGLPLEITAIDPDPRALAFAREEASEGVTFRRATTAELVAEGLRFPIVISNHVLHHLPVASLSDFLREAEALAEKRIVLSDIERSPVGYLLFSLATVPLFRDSYIRTDGLLSIQRSFTASELRTHLPPGWTVERHPPFRLVAIWRPGREHGA